jgi:hypothetical protein
MSTVYLFLRAYSHETQLNAAINTLNRTSQNFVKKKAALTLLRLYRKHPDVIPAAEWALRIVSIMDDEDLARTLTIVRSSLLINVNMLFPGCRRMRDKFSHGISTRSS